MIRFKPFGGQDTVEQEPGTKAERHEPFLLIEATAEPLVVKKRQFDTVRWEDDREKGKVGDQESGGG